MPSGRIFRFIALMGAKMGTKFARRAEKNDNRLIFDESRCLGSGSLDLGSSIYFSTISMFPVTRRARWAHPNSKSNTVFGKSSK